MTIEEIKKEYADHVTIGLYDPDKGLYTMTFNYGKTFVVIEIKSKKPGKFSDAQHIEIHKGIHTILDKQS